MSEPRASQLHHTPAGAIREYCSRCLAALVLFLVSLGNARLVSAADASGSDPFETPESFDALGDEADFFKVESDIVTSVSRHPESSWGAAAAITVVTGEEIEASGAQSLTGRAAHRSGPRRGLGRPQHERSVRRRGLNNTFADKMLVLLDGRPIYNPIFGGTIWHEWNQFVPDIDRIEVIRGPGGTLWGANAMNGVINIITKSAEDTTEESRALSAASNYQGQGEMRYGNQIGAFDWRLWGATRTDNGFGGDGGDKIDDKRTAERAGYRFDYDLGRGLVLRSTGDFLSQPPRQRNHRALVPRGCAHHRARERGPDVEHDALHDDVARREGLRRRVDGASAGGR